MPLFMYLNGCTKNEMPSDDEYERIFTGVEFESSSTFPLFWLCLFQESDIKKTLNRPERPGSSEEKPERPYPYLVCPTDQALANARGRRQSLEQLLDSRQLKLYDEFIGVVASQFQPFILVRTVQYTLDQGRTVFELSLRETLEVMNNKSPDTWLVSLGWSDLTGFFKGEGQNHSPADANAYELCGSDMNSSWPLELPEKGRDDFQNVAQEQVVDNSAIRYEYLQKLRAMETGVPFMVHTSFSNGTYSAWSRWFLLVLLGMLVVVFSGLTIWFGIWFFAVVAAGFAIFWQAILRYAWVKFDFDANVVRGSNVVVPFRELAEGNFAIVRSGGQIAVYVQSKLLGRYLVAAFTGANKDKEAVQFKAYLAAICKLS